MKGKKNGKAIRAQVPWPKELRTALFELVDEIAFSSAYVPDLWAFLCASPDGPSRDRAAGFLIGVAGTTGSSREADGSFFVSRSHWQRKARSLLTRLELIEDGEAKAEKTNGQPTSPEAVPVAA